MSTRTKAVWHRWALIRHLQQTQIVIWAVCLLFLPSCAVQQPFLQPEQPSVEHYTSGQPLKQTAASPITGGESQQFEFGKSAPEQWWTLFEYTPLNELIQDAIRNSPTIAAAQARLQEAQENLRSRTGALQTPALDANLAASRSKTYVPSVNAASTYTLYNASIGVSYNLDLFQGKNYELEALVAQVEYQRLQLEGAHLALSGNIVTAAIQEGSLRAQMAAINSIIGQQEKVLELVQQQYALGSVSQAEVLAQQAQLAQTRTNLPALEKNLAQTRNLLAILSGKLPSKAQLPEFSLESFTLPQEIPVSLPSEFVRKRPDIRAAEALWQAASAQVGIATANLYPHISLTGSLGGASTQLDDLLTTSFWSLGGGLLQPVFHGGELTAKRQAAVAAYEQAGANYQATMLMSFKDVANALKAIEFDAMALKAQSDAETAAKDALNLSRSQFELGATSYISLLNGETRFQQAHSALVQGRAARLADTAALLQALGGGWLPGENVPALAVEPQR